MSSILIELEASLPGGGAWEIKVICIQKWDAILPSDTKKQHLVPHRDIKTNFKFQTLNGITIMSIKFSKSLQS